MTEKNTGLNVGAFQFNDAPTVELHTNTGIILWNGRAASEGKPFIISFPSFLKRLHNMEDAIAKDDPFADKTYYHVEKMIEEAKEVLAAKSLELSDLLNSGHSRLKFPETAITKPAEVKVKSFSRLGWQAIEVLLSADDVSKLVYMAQHRGYINKSTKGKLIAEMLGTVRSVLNQVLQWKYTGITRDDYAANNGVAQLAKEKLKHYDSIEEEFLKAKLRSDFAPDLPKKRLIVTPEENNKSDDSELEELAETFKQVAETKVG